MNIDLEKLQELAKEASQGNWKADRNCGVSIGNVQIAATTLHTDAAFISAANPATVSELAKLAKGSILDCIADVQAEPEFPGEIPPELMAHIRQCIETKDEQSLIQMMRMAVSITKKGIQERIAARTALSGPTRSAPSIQMRVCRMGWIRRTTASTAPACSAAANVASQ